MAPFIDTQVTDRISIVIRRFKFAQLEWLPDKSTFTFFYVPFFE
jgi:hypothetical protein